MRIYNGGGNRLSYYAYTNPAEHGSIPECPSSASPPLSFASHLKEVGTTMVETRNVPFSARHPGNNTAFDAAIVQSQVSIPVKTRKVKGKTVAFGDTTLCPANHRRHISIKFTLENGKSQTATANAACK